MAGTAKQQSRLDDASRVRRARIWHLTSWTFGILFALLFIGCILSLRWRVERNGSPFNLHVNASRGRVLAWWMLQRGDGSRSGFGNEGWWLVSTGWQWPAIVPRVVHAPAPDPRSYALVSVPLWPVVVVLGMASWRCRVRARRIGYAAEGRCLSCGYDVRGLNRDAACPECGAFRLSDRDSRRRATA